MIKRELVFFLFVGALTVIVDFISYRGLIQFQAIEVDIAKATGFLIGALFAYYANRFCTFGHKPHTVGSPWRFIILYTGTLGINVIVNALSLKLLPSTSVSFKLAFLFATVVSACLNFLGMKFFVFRTSHSS